MTTTPPIKEHPSLDAGYGRLAGLVQGVFLLYVGITVVSTGFVVWQRSVFLGWADEPDSIDTNLAERMDTVTQVLSIAAVVCLLVMGFLFIRWLWLGVRSPDVDREAIRYAPFWAIIGWFLPILNLFRPFQMVRNFWRGANIKKATGAAHNPQIVAWWWGILLASFVSERLVLAMIRNSEDLSGSAFYQAQAQLTLVEVGDNVLTATAAVLAAILVNRITAVILS